jgi:hypothetical protein
MNIVARFFANQVLAKRAPDEVIGLNGDVYLNRWYLIKRGWINLYLHQFIRSDDARALHDHPGDNISILLDGSYREWMPWAHVDNEYNIDPPVYTYKVRSPGLPIFRRAENLHRIELFKDSYGYEIPVLTLFWRFKHRREWGFSCKDGWKNWRDFNSSGCN